MAPGSRCDPRWPSQHRKPSPLPWSRRKARRAAGFTLLEILISMALTGFGVLCLAALLKAIGDMEAQDTWATKALFCAQERIEELKFEIAVGNGSVGQGEEDLAVGSYAGMRRQWTVAPSSIADGLLEVAVECAYLWKDTTQTVGLSTLVFREY